tara:strand:+ start:878 stop:1078 length:201 start_codon:yes stop_codon:yes gene_type:complete
LILNYKEVKMNIESAKYNIDVLTNEKCSINIIVNGILLSVPLDPANRHYQAIQEWVAEGNKIEEAD